MQNNHHKIASINDSSYSQGQFGICADANTEAAYTNAGRYKKINGKRIYT